MPGILRNFSLKLFGDTHQVLVNSAAPETCGLPPPAEPPLPQFTLADAIDGEPDLFRALRWDHGLVDTLYGRDDDLRAILDWAEKPSKAAEARLVTGPGGAGKTRLAAEAARVLKGKGWTAGLLPRDDVHFSVGDTGLLLILDYPEEQTARTEALLRKLAQLSAAPYPIRILLLSRRSYEDWTPMADLLEGRFGRQAIAAPGLLAEDDAAPLIAEAAERLAAVLKRPVPDLAGAPAWLEQRKEHRLPLFAAAAAIHAVIAPSEAFGLAGADLMRALARREARRVREVSKTCGLGEDGLARLLALGVVGDGLSQGTVAALAQAGAVPDLPDLVDRLANTPWWQSGRLMRLQPDRPAAAFLDAVLFPEKKFPDGLAKLPDWLFLALEDNAASFAGRLSRLHYDLAALDRPGPGHPLDASLTAMLDRDAARAGVFEAIASKGENEVSHWAAAFAVEVTLRLAQAESDEVRRASLLGNAAIYLSLIGRHEDALSHQMEVSKLFRKLAQESPDAFTPNLAASLNNLAIRLSALGRHQAALAPAEEAVALGRDLARARPDAFTPNLAMSLNTLANSLSDLGQHEAALAPAQEATDLYRELARARPDAFTPYLALSLNTLATALSALGRHQAALAPAQEAVDLYRDLARARPDAVTPDLAMSLNTLANRLSALGRHQAALAPAQEAADLYRELARARPDAFTPDLALSLNNLAVRLSALGRHQAALAPAQEAADLYRELTRARPDSFTPDLAASLNTLATALSALGRHQAALAPAQEAADLYRDLARARPDAVTPDLAMSLNTLANRLFMLGRPAEALDHVTEAIKLLAPFFLKLPKAHERVMVTMCRNYRLLCQHLGREPDAALLGPIVAVLDSLQPPDEAETPPVA